MSYFCTVLLFCLCGLPLSAQAQQPPPPPPPPPPPHGPPGPLGPHPGERIPELRRSFGRLRPVNQQAQAAIDLGRYFLQRAGSAAQEHEPFQADRYAAAADAQIHIAGRQQHAGRESEAPFPPGEEVSRHLERAYFRLQQADYFLSQTRDARAKDLPQTGRRFYESAVQAYDKGDYLPAEEDARCVDDTVRTLEELAQAASPMPPPPPPPHPPHTPPPHTPPPPPPGPR